jgi:pimeloyl-ACP methyl ester carboxylesterase
MGGAITVNFADRHPERVNCIALLAPAGFNLNVPAKYAALAWPGVGEWMLKAFGDATLPSTLERMGVPEDAPYRREFIEQTRYRGFKRAILSTYRNFPLLELQPVYERVGKTDIPTLLIWGDADHVVPFTHHERVEETIPQVEFHAIPGGSHTANYEKPEQVNPILIDFLRRHNAVEGPAAEDTMEVNEAA